MKGQLSTVPQTLTYSLTFYSHNLMGEMCAAEKGGKKIATSGPQNARFFLEPYYNIHILHPSYNNIFSVVFSYC